MSDDVGEARGDDCNFVPEEARQPRDRVANDSCASSCSLWRYDYPAGQGRIKTTDLFVWACVNSKTGEVEMEVQQFDDELNEDLVEDWEWRRFRLVEANKEVSRESSESVTPDSSNQ